MTIQNNLDPSHPFYLDKNLTGSAMRDQAVKFSNLFSYWNEKLGEFEAKRKTLQAIYDQSKDKAKGKLALQAIEKGYKAAIQDAYIKNFHDVIISIGGEDISPGDIQKELSSIQEREIEARVNVEILKVAVDIARSALSWDKQEHQNMET